MVRVMIAEDDKKIRQDCLENLTKDESVKVVSCVDNGSDAVSKYLKIQPDVLLLDLKMPKMNGIEVLKVLSNFEKGKHKPNVIVVSGNKRMITYAYQSEKVFKVMEKPVQWECLLNNIRKIKTGSDDPLEHRIKRLLNELGISVFKSGGKFLVIAIKTAFKDNQIVHKLQNLYEEVSKQCGVPPSKVKWSIRSAIDFLNRNVYMKDFCNFFDLKYNPQTITPKLFIELMVEYLKED